MEIFSTEIDGVLYDEVDLIEVNGNKYAYLVNENDEDDFVIRKVVNEEYTALNDKTEYELALMYYLKKHKDEVEEN